MEKLTDKEQGIVDFVSRYSMITSLILEKKDLGGLSYLRKATGGLSKRGILEKRNLIPGTRESYWALTKKAKTMKLVDSKFEPALPGEYRGGKDQFQEFKRYARLMFCCGGNRERTLLSRTEARDLLGNPPGTVQHSTALYIDKSMKKDIGQALIGHIQISEGATGLEGIKNKLEERANKLVQMDYYRPLIEQNLFVLSYLCEEKTAPSIEKYLTKQGIDMNGIWLNICPIRNLETIRSRKT